MTEEKLLEDIKLFTDACDKMTASKFIMIDKRIGDVLKSIAKTDAVFDLIKECMINFNFEMEWKKATSKIGYLLPPDEVHKFIAFAFTLLNCLDDKKLSASELLSKCFSKSESSSGPYAEFCELIIVRFKNAIVAKLLNNNEIVASVSDKKKDIEKSINQDVLSRLAFLAKDMKDYVQGLKKLKGSKVTKGELAEIINGLYLAVKNKDVQYIKCFVLAIKTGKGKNKEIERRLVEIMDIVNKTLIDA